MKADYAIAGLFILGAALILAGIQVLAGTGFTLIAGGFVTMLFALIVLRGLTNG
jgi:hypothetical protein